MPKEAIVDIQDLNSLPANAKVGIVGVPPSAAIKLLSDKIIFDLDEPIVKQSMEKTISYLPRVYCAILRTVVLNALHLELDAIVIDVGYGKCDCALHVANILVDLCPIPIIQTRNNDQEPFGIPVCQTKMNTIEKLERITSSIQTLSSINSSFVPCPPTVGFWGVPPRDFSLLKYFPDTTHIYGWSRCMENKTPDNLSLESHFNPNIPTVFFAQTFCAKTALAKHLASKHPQSLFLDSDISTTSSIRAKIQAFLELSASNPNRPHIPPRQPPKFIIGKIS